MTVVLDSWAVLCLLDGESSGAERVARALADRPTMSWINLGEVLYVLLRRARRDEARTAIRDVQALVAVELPSESTVRQAAEIKARHRMSYADAFAAATAIQYDAELWTGNPELLVRDATWRSVNLRV